MTESSTLIATAADAGFYRMLAGLLLSFEAHCDLEKIDIALFDLGLTVAQREWAESRVTRIVEPGWDLDVPKALRHEKPILRGLTVRPFLPQHFPGYDIYMWIDADIWLQDSRGIELYRLGALSSDLTATPHTDRAYPFNRAISAYSYRQYKQAYGKDVADDVWPQQILNAGAFAAPAMSPLWNRWAEAYQGAINKVVTSDQLALNFTCYRESLKVQLLPALFNWQCHLSVPMWNPRAGKFCEPYLPYAQISLLHLTHNSKSTVYDIRSLNGQIRQMTLQNPELASATLPPHSREAKSIVGP